MAIDGKDRLFADRVLNGEDRASAYFATHPRCKSLNCARVNACKLLAKKEVREYMSKMTGEIEEKVTKRVSTAIAERTAKQAVKAIDWSLDHSVKAAIRMLDSAIHDAEEIRKLNEERRERQEKINAYNDAIREYNATCEPGEEKRIEFYDRQYEREIGAPTQKAFESAIDKLNEMLHLVAKVTGNDVETKRPVAFDILEKTMSEFRDVNPDDHTAPNVGGDKGDG